jgi:pimeloyl-ACP methyl ester carboxylesterase
VPIRKGYVDTKDGQIHYRSCEGGKGLPILFFHMTASSSASFESLMSSLDGFCPMYAFDLPHYGQSFVPTAEPSYEYVADVLIEAIDNLNIDRFHCFGHHGGTNVSAQLAAAYPERVASIMLAGVTYPTMQESERNKGIIYDNPADIRGSQVITAWTRVVKDCDTSAPVAPEEPFYPVPAEIYHRELIDTLTAGTEWHWGYRAVFKHNMPEVLGKVSCPILLVAGRRDIVFFWHERAKKALPHAKVVERDGYGTYYCTFAGDDLAPFIKRFINDLGDIGIVD